MRGASVPWTVAVCGAPGVGKSALIEGLLPLLRAERIRTAVVRRTTAVAPGPLPGAEADRLLAAGALGCAVYDERRSLVVRQGRAAESHFISQFRDADLVLLEGFDQSFWPKLELVRPPVSERAVCDPSTLLAVVTDAPVSLYGVPTLPPSPGAVSAFLTGWLRRRRGEPEPAGAPPAAPAPAGRGGRAAVISVSDAAYAGERPDAAGPVAVRCLNGAGWRVVSTGLLPCDRAMLGAELRRLCGGADLVVTVGGCGLSRWDCAPEAACDAAERAVPGLSAALRAGWLALSQNAVLDRGTAVIRGGALIVNLPGDPAVLPALLETLLAAVGDNAVFQRKAP